MKSNIWIKWYKVLVCISAVVILLIGFVIGVDEAYYLGELLIYVVPFALGAGSYLVVGMLIATFFENVQVIREKLEVMCGESPATNKSNHTEQIEKNTKIPSASPVSTKDIEFVKVTCPKCNSKINIPSGKSKWFCPLCSQDIDIK